MAASGVVVQRLGSSACCRANVRAPTAAKSRGLCSKKPGVAARVRGWPLRCTCRAPCVQAAAYMVRPNSRTLGEIRRRRELYFGSRIIPAGTISVRMRVLNGGRGGGLNRDQASCFACQIRPASILLVSARLVAGWSGDWRALSLQERAAACPTSQNQNNGCRGMRLSGRVAGM
jgi:hypothetical protein